MKNGNFKLIFTCREEFSGISKNEIKNAAYSINTYNNDNYKGMGSVRPCEESGSKSGSKFEKWIADGIGIASTDYPFDKFSEMFINSKPIFTRHINPIDVTLKLELNSEDYTRIEQEAIENIIPRLDLSKSFSVQTRVLNKTLSNDDYSPFKINNKISELITSKTKANLDVRNPDQIVSVVISGSDMYLGLSEASCNMSNWAGGDRRFSKEKDRISRSEFKLLEAIELFDLDLTSMKTAVDLGASPGGWTRILRKHYDMRVSSVDPADIHTALTNDKKVKHIRKTAQKFAMTNKLQYDIIVNDMKIDIHESVNVMLDLESSLNPYGIAIMTLKLPRNNVIKAINNAIHKISKAYRVVGARQLFHNRHEITLALSKK